MPPRRVPTYDYPSHFLVRRCSRGGTVRVLGRQVLVSYTLAGDFARLEKVDEEVFDPCRCFSRIGRSRLRSNRIQNALSRVASSRRQIDLAARALPMS